MASILPVGGKWRALIRRKGHKTQCRTFGSKAAAEAWARGVETDLDRGVDRTGVVHTLTVGEIITAYRKLRDRTRPILDTSTEHYMLRIIDTLLGDKAASKLTTQDLVGFAMARHDDGAGAYTVNQDLSKLGTVFRYGGAVLNIALPDVVGAARPTLTYLGLIGGGGRRDRRPTPDELERVIGHFLERHGARYADALTVAAVTAMRAGEVVGLKWVDLNESTRVASVQRKHPRKGKTLERVPLMSPAWEVIQAQPRDGDLIFPFKSGTLSTYFTKACQELSIPDLRLHDLRHEATSALFEQGFSIEQVALVTGHKTWAMLRRYTNLRPEDLSAPD
jgi:integrase